MLPSDDINWQKKKYPHLFPSEEIACTNGLNKFDTPSFQVYESKALLDIGRCETLTKGGMVDQWVDGYVQPRFLLRPMSLINLQGEAIRLFSVQYYKHKGNIGQLTDTISKNLYARGFIIGDGTGVGKSREIVGMIMTTILVERYMNKNDHPLLIWLTCNELLIDNCIKAFAEVLTVGNKEQSIKNISDNGFNIADLEGNDMYVKFITIKSFLAKTHGGLTAPTVLFITYHALMIHFIHIMQIFDKDIIKPTAVFCDEFHKAKNISETMLKTHVQNQTNDYIKTTSCIKNYSKSIYKILQGKNNKNDKMHLSIADSFKVFVDFLKFDTFFVMSSATPFQNNNDLHIIDHIIKNVAPHYHLLNKYDSVPIGMNSSEYSTLFLESVIKLLYNHGIYISRTISLNDIRCSIIQKPISSANTYMMDEISCYLAEMKKLAKTAKLDICLLDKAINKLLKSKQWESPKEIVSNLREFCNAVNNDIHKDVSIQTGYRLYFVKWENAWKVLKKDRHEPKRIKKDTDSLTLYNNDDTQTLKLFSSRPARLLSGQYKTYLAACCVAISKNILLSLKSKYVLEYIHMVRREIESQKMIISVEQTGDSYYNHITNEMLKINNDNNNNKLLIKRLSILDKAPASHFIINAYKTLLRSILLDTTYGINLLKNEKMCFFLLPRLPAVAPLTLLNENFLDSIEVGVGEGRYIEVTKRKFIGRLEEEGTLSIYPLNTTAKYTKRDFQLFKHSNSVDIAIVGRTGNTGFDFHDSKDNIAKARRIHILADLPHDAISFLQSIGRTNRNNQVSLPRYWLFLTNIPIENRFVDTLESRVRDSKAGTYGDRYCQNTLSLKNNKKKNITTTNNNNSDCSGNDNNNNIICTSNGTYSHLQLENIDKTDFLENEFVMKVLGITLQFLAGQYNILNVFLQIAKLGYRSGKLFIPLEGLGDSKMCIDIYLRIVSFAFECAAELLHEKNIAATVDAVVKTSYNFKYTSKIAEETIALLDSKKKEKILKKLLHCLCYFYDSSIMDFGLRGEENKVDGNIQTIVSIAIDFWQTFCPYVMVKTSHLLLAVKQIEMADTGGKMRDFFSNAAIIVFGHFNNDTLLPPPTEVLTLSIYNNAMKILIDGAQESIPIVAACNLLSVLKDKTPDLLLNLVNEITPYRKKNGNFNSCLLMLSKLLVNRGLTYKQFRNYFMTIPLSEQYLLQSLFSKVREWLSTEEWFSRMCMIRKDNYLSAEYINITQCPEDRYYLYAKIDNNDTKHVSSNVTFSLNCRLLLCSKNNQISNTRGDLYKCLTQDNTIFVESLFDILLLTNSRQDLIKLKFSNYESMGLPSIAFVSFQ
nr:MAG: wsv026-like protein [Metapenaeopsis lamellata majanivirus]